MRYARLDWPVLVIWPRDDWLSWNGGSNVLARQCPWILSALLYSVLRGNGAASSAGRIEIIPPSLSVCARNLQKCWWIGRDPGFVSRLAEWTVRKCGTLFLAFPFGDPKYHR